MITEVFDRSKFTIVSARHGVTVFYNGIFWENADSYSEAIKDIDEACGNT